MELKWGKRRLTLLHVIRKHMLSEHTVYLLALVKMNQKETVV